LVILAYLLVEIIAAQTIPSSLWSKESAGASTAIPLVMIAMYLMAVFVNTDADFACTSSGYPTYLFTLPVRTGDLAVWPLLFGSGSLALIWIGVAELVFIPRGIPTPLWWPAALLASTLACLQAIIWSPIPLPYLRALLAIVLLPTSIFLGVAAFESGLKEILLVAGYLGLIPFAFAVAHNGLKQARKGCNPEWSWAPERSKSASDAKARHARPFASAEQAQVWMEWKRNGATFPLFVGVSCALFSLPLLFIHETDSLRFVPPGAGPIEANVCLNFLAACLALPLWFGMVLGAGARKMDTRGKDLSIHPFIAARPMTSASIVATKLKAAALSAAAAWLVLLGLLILWLFLPAKEGDTSARLGYLFLRHLTLKQGAITALALAGLVALTWKLQTDGLYIDLSGSKWLVHGFPVLFGLGITALLMVFAGTYSNPEILPKLVHWLPIAAMTVATAKLAARAWVLRSLISNRAIAPRTGIFLIAGWGLLAALLFTLMLNIIPPGLAQPKYMAVGVFLILPFARLGAAPLMLEWNRHR
jgi:hypothetical protein